MADDNHPVFLGTPDTGIDEKDDKLCRWDTNKFGGRPNWMLGSPDKYPTCVMCGEMLYLVAQIYCPLDHSVYHRTLYIFSCANPPCWNTANSWLVLRSQTISSIDKEYSVNKSHEKQSSADDWCDDAGDWGNEEDSTDLVMADLEGATSRMTLHSTVHEIQDENLPPVIDLPLQQYNMEAPFFAPHYLSVFEDTTTLKKSTKISLTAHEKDLLAKYQENQGKDFQDMLKSSVDNEHEVAEYYEKTIVTHGDYSFHKFSKYLQSCPHQCIRYQWTGTPLSISDTYKPSDMQAIPCQYCGASRIFELQLMPALVLLLKGKETQSPSNHSANQYKDTRDHDVSIVTGFLGDEATVNDSIGRQALSNNAATHEYTKNVPNDCNSQRDDNAIKDNVIAENLDSRIVNLKQLSNSISHSKQAGIEFGTVLVFSCSQSCWDNNNTIYRQECVQVQADPDAELFTKKDVS